MAKYEAFVDGEFNQILVYLEEELTKGSQTLSLEEASDYQLGNTRVAIRAYERYSYWGGNRVSLHLTVFSDGEETIVTAISTGGSQGMTIKINTWSESNFLNTIIPAIEKIKK